LNIDKKEKEINNYHNCNISNFRHFFDKIDNNDIVMSISHEDNNIKLFNINNWECISNLTNINSKGKLLSACFLNDKNKNYIITSNYEKNGHPEQIKVFDFNGNKIKNIKNSDDKTLIINSYFDHLLSKYYIIAGNDSNIKSYNYDKNEIYHIYNDKNNNVKHFDFIVSNNNNVIILIDSCDDGFIRIWSFHSCILLKKIFIGEWVFSMCLWNDNYLFAGCKKNIKLIELKNGLIVKNVKCHNNYVGLKKIIHPNYGECLITQNCLESNIKIWSIK
jgi:WD40 repeat protein